MTQPQGRPDSSTQGKAVSYGGGTGIGAVLYQLAELCPNEKIKAIIIICIPASAIGIADLGKYVWNDRKKSRGKIKRDRELNSKIAEIDSLLEREDLGSSMKNELIAKRDEAILARLE
jgi:hypothetical protein